MRVLKYLKLLWILSWNQQFDVSCVRHKSRRGSYQALGCLWLRCHSSCFMWTGFLSVSYSMQLLLLLLICWVMLMMLRLCSEDDDASLSCAFLWKSVFDMMSHLLQSAGQDAYIALSSPLVNHWKLISGMTYLFIYLFLQDWLYGFPGLFTDISEHIHFLLVSFCLFHFFSF